jgi:diguanylate cyclase (GGDEF)-like protein
LGGDEFVVVLPDLNAGQAASVIAEKIRDAIQQPYIMENGNRFEISSSIGVALYPTHAEDAHALLGMADDAMYVAKMKGKNKVEVAEPNAQK